MGDECKITREEVELIVQLEVEKSKGEIMEKVVKNTSNIEANRTDLGEIKSDIKTIMNILRGKDRFAIATMATSIITLITIAVTIIIAVVS